MSENIMVRDDNNSKKLTIYYLIVYLALTVILVIALYEIIIHLPVILNPDWIPFNISILSIGIPLLGLGIFITALGTIGYIGELIDIQ